MKATKANQGEGYGRQTLMTARQAVALAILLTGGGGIESKSPDYIEEKVKAHDLTNMLDQENQRRFNAWAEKWGATEVTRWTY
jgi:hypothetical protein